MKQTKKNVFIPSQSRANHRGLRTCSRGFDTCVDPTDHLHRSHSQHPSQVIDRCCFGIAECSKSKLSSYRRDCAYRPKERFQPSTDIAGQTPVKSSVQRGIRSAILSSWKIEAETLEEIWPKKESIVHVKWSVSHHRESCFTFSLLSVLMECF